MEPEKENEEPEYSGLPVLGYHDNDEESVRILEIGTEENAGLNAPRDLAFNPDRPDELWVVNREDDSVSIFFDAGLDSQNVEHIVDPFAEHFMEEVSSIAFGKKDHFGTCQESRNTYNGQAMANNFMGPTLWSSDLSIFGESNEEAIDALTHQFGFYTDLGSHLDMLHESPLCMGIAWEKDNVYWVFDGWHSDIVRYDFADDHGPGWDDHSDGEIVRYANDEIAMVRNVPSHMEMDRETGLLYIVDTGNIAIKVLDTTIGTRGDDLPVVEPGTTHYNMEDYDIKTIVDGNEYGMEYPSGLALVEDTLFISDYGTGKIFAFDLDGELIDEYQTALGAYSLTGIFSRNLDELWFVGTAHNKLWKIEAVD
jgi:hypothetical protein